MSPYDVGFVDPTRDREWESSMASHPESTVFHSSGWARVLISTYGHKPFYLRFSRAGETAAVLPIMEVSSRLTGCRGVSLPFSDLCGPLCFGDFNPQFLVKGLSGLAHNRNWRYLEIRGGPPVTQSISMPLFFGHTLDLSVGLKSLRARVTGAVRRNLRKAEESGVTIEISRGWHQLLEFYRLHVRTRRRHGLPPQSVSFFSNVYEHLVKPGLGFVVLAAVDSRRIAAAVFLHNGRKGVYKFGASDERFQQHRANNLVMWRGIQFLAQIGVDTLHFGRTSVDNHGLRRFKLGWGAKEEAVVYSRLDPLTEKWTSPPAEAAGFHHKVFGSLPLSVNRLIGTLCYPHLD